VSNGVLMAVVSDPPTDVTATAGAGQATVSWTMPAYNGGASVTTYTVTSNAGQTCTATAPAASCTVTGLTGGTSYTFTVTATNAIGVSSASAISNAVTPTAPIGTPAPTPTCTASVSTQSTWVSGSNGYGQVIVSVTNSGSVAIKGWTVTINWPKTMTIPYGFYNSSVTGSGSAKFVVSNVDFNVPIAVGASVPNDQRPGFTAYGATSYAAPTSVTCSAS
jgi:hypothetical protein